MIGSISFYFNEIDFRTFKEIHDILSRIDNVLIDILLEKIISLVFARKSNVISSFFSENNQNVLIVRNLLRHYISLVGHSKYFWIIFHMNGK